MSKEVSVNLNKLRQELERRRKILINIAHDSSVNIDHTEKNHIIEYLEKENLPQQPTKKIQIIKEFVSSALSINQPPFRIRNKLQDMLGEIPVGETMPKCLTHLFGDQRFLNDDNWSPSDIEQLIIDLSHKNNDPFKNHILITIESISWKLDKQK